MQKVRDCHITQNDIDDLYVLIRKQKYSKVGLLQTIDTSYRKDTNPVQYDSTDPLCVTEHIMLAENIVAEKIPLCMWYDLWEYQFKESTLIFFELLVY